MHSPGLGLVGHSDGRLRGAHWPLNEDRLDGVRQSVHPSVHVEDEFVVAAVICKTRACTCTRGKILMSQYSEQVGYKLEHTVQRLTALQRSSLA